MRFTITSQRASIPLELDIYGYHIEVSDLTAHSVSVSDSNGRLSVCCIEPQAVSLDTVDLHAVPSEITSEDIVPAEQVSSVQNSDIPETSQAVETTIDTAIEQAVADLKAEVSEVIDAEQLFQHLVDFRRQIASEVKLPPYIIFHDKTLKDMCRLLPTDLSELSAIQGVGQSKLEKYGSRFIQAIQEYILHLKEVA